MGRAWVREVWAGAVLAKERALKGPRSLISTARMEGTEYMEKGAV